MYPVVNGLRKEGYAVYYWQQDDARSELRDIKHAYDKYIEAYPTTLIFKDGQLVKIHVGVISIATMKRDLKLNPKKPDYKI